MSEELNKLLEDAQAACRTRSYFRAQRLFQLAISLDAGSLIAWHGLIDAVRELGHYDRALSLIESALDKFPNEFWIRSQQGRVLSALGKYEDARSVFNELIVQNPSEPSTHLFVADTHGAQDRHDLQREVLCRTSGAFPENEWVRLYMARFEEGESRRLAHEGCARLESSLSQGDLSHASGILTNLLASPSCDLTTIQYLLWNTLLYPDLHSLVANHLHHEIELRPNAHAQECIAILAADFERQRRGEEGIAFLQKYFDILLASKYNSAPIAQQLVDLVFHCSNERAAQLPLESLLYRALDLTRTNRAEHTVLLFSLFILARVTSSGSVADSHWLAEIVALIADDGITFLFSIDQVAAVAMSGPKVTLPDIFEALKDVIGALKRRPPSKHTVIVILFFRRFLADSTRAKFLSLLNEYISDFSISELFQLFATCCYLTASQEHQQEVLQTLHALNVKICDTSTSVQLLNALVVAQVAPHSKRESLEAACLRVLAHRDSTNKYANVHDDEEFALDRLLVLYHQIRLPVLQSSADPLTSNLRRKLELLQRPQLSRKAKRDAPRVAVCVSGQLRNVQHVLPTWKDLFLARDNVHIYVHTWDDTVNRVGPVKEWVHFLPRYSAAALQYIGYRHQGELARTLYPTLFNYLEFPAKAPSINSIAQLYTTTPDRIVVEDATSSPFSDMSNQAKMEYKIRQCHQLMKQSKCEYDLVVRIRPDFCVKLDPEFDWNKVYSSLYRGNTIGFRHPRSFVRNNFFVCDQFAVSRPELMNLYCEYDTLAKELREEQVFWCSDKLAHWKIGWMMWLFGIDSVQIPHISGELYSPREVIAASLLQDLVRVDVQRRHFHLDILLLESIGRDLREEPHHI